MGLSTNYNALRSEPQYLLLTPHFPVFSPLLTSKISYRTHYREIPCFSSVSPLLSLKIALFNLQHFCNILNVNPNLQAFARYMTNNYIITVYNKQILYFVVIPFSSSSYSFHSPVLQ